jgi:hypothetical protein
MSQASKRFLVYILILVFLTTIFNYWPSLPPAYATGAQLAQYAGDLLGLVIRMLVWMVVFDGVYHIIRGTVNWDRRRHPPKPDPPSPPASQTDNESH